MKGILARKIGMTRFISPETGEMSPVTVLEAPKNSVLQVKTSGKDGYSAIVLGAFERSSKKKNKNQNYKFSKELRLEDGTEIKEGDSISLESLQGVESVTISAISKGRGFAGVIKRHNFQRGRETHGSHHHREPGSVGMCAKPGRILRGKRMPGHYGNVQKTIRSVKVIHIDLENNLIAIKGPVPGSKNNFVFLSVA